MLASFEIDGTEIHDGADYWITEVGGGLFGSPPARDNTVDRAQQHGVLDLSEFYAGRTMEFSGIVIGDDEADAMAKLDALKGLIQVGEGLAGDYEQLGVNVSAPLHAAIFQRVGDTRRQKFYFRCVDFAAPMDVPNRIIPWSMTILAPDPRFYELNEDDVGTQTYNEIEILHGTDDDITVGGNTPTPAWFTMQGPFDDWCRVDGTVGVDPIGKDKLLLDLPALNNVDIVTRSRLAIKNQTIRHDIVDRANTDWFYLPPGVVNIAFSVAGGATGATVLRVRWHNARI